MGYQHPLLEPWTPTTNDPFDATKAAHLLNRAGFGGTTDEIQKIVQLGPRAAVDSLMDFPDAPAEEQGRGDSPNLATISDYPQSFQQYAQMLAGKTKDERQQLVQRFMQANRQAVDATLQWWLNRMVSGQYPLQEKLTLFWHGHFTSSAKDERSALLLWRQNELLRRYAVGNLEPFVRAISRDPAMLDYLNNNDNRKAHPNENYARELMELFTLGIGNYTEDDIKQSARAFTGWGHDGVDFVYRQFQHDGGLKTFMGKTGNFDGDDIITIILQKPACAKFIAGELFNYFAYDNQDQGLAEALGNLLRDNHYALRPTIRTMLTSKAFYSSQSIGVQIKSPVQLVIGLIRMLDLSMPPSNAIESALSQMGQLPLNPPNVRGWPGGKMWINTSTLFIRYNTGVWMAGGDVPALTRLTVKGDTGQPLRAGMRGHVNFDPSNVKTPDTPTDTPTDTTADSSQLTAGQVVDRWVATLIQRPLDDGQRDVLISSLGDDPTSPESQRRLVQLIVSTPEFQLC